MRMSLLRKAVLALGLTALLGPAVAFAQVREVISKEVSVGRSETTLRLEFADNGTLEITFEDGTVRVDGEVVGSFEPGDELEAEWRELLSQAVALDDGPLAAALADWTVPAALASELADVAREIDQALEEALSEVDIRVDTEDGSVSVSIGDESSLIQLLLGSVGRLGLLEEALRGLDADFLIHVEEDVVVPEGSVIEGTLVVIDGDLRVAGEVEGDVVVIGGTLDLLEGSRVAGQVRIADSRIVRNQGTVEDGLVDVLEDERDFEAQLRDRLRSEVQEEVRRDLRNEIRNVTRGDDSFSIMAPFRPVVRGVGGVLEKLLAVLILGLIGAGFIAFAGDNVDTIAETARRAPARAAMVGFAGTFLLIPVWILGAVALCVSIIGIPVAIAWLPLFPLAACAAAVIGYLAVALTAGEWLADSDYPWTGWIRKSNPLITLFGGLLGLAFAFMAANVISIAPFLGFFSGLLYAAGTIITILAVQIGFGAVILTRAGRRRESWSHDPDAAWEAAMSADVEDVDMRPEAGQAETETKDTGEGDEEDDDDA